MMITRITNYTPQNTNFGRKYDYEGYALTHNKISKSIAERNKSNNPLYQSLCTQEINELSKIAEVAGRPDYNDDTTIKKYLQIRDAIGETNVQISRIQDAILEMVLKDEYDDNKKNQLEQDKNILITNRNKLFEMKESLKQKILNFNK